ncbi:MAG: alpha/beta hydrolase [Pyrinomonadaceae bacterium]|nr:alpha/beta hydrolase [Pyrinomonadaceae bacterium]
MNEFLVNEPDGKAYSHFVFAHGAGAPMDTPFMNVIAEGLADRGIRVSRFEFPYMAKRREDGKRRGPGNATRLLGFYRDIVNEIRNDLPLFIGGKSMGGRIASMIADEDGLSGIICLGYPFHPPGKPENLRTEHLRTMKLPTLIIQGERDPFGRPEEVGEYDLAKTIKVVWIPDGDHSLKPRKKSGYDEAGNLSKAVEAASEFIKISGRQT